MNSALSRLNGLFAFTLTVLGGITVLCYLSTAFMDRSVPDSSAAASPSYSIKLWVSTRDFLLTTNWCVFFSHSVPNPRGGAHHDMGSLLLDISAGILLFFTHLSYCVFLCLTNKHQISQKCLIGTPNNCLCTW